METWQLWLMVGVGALLLIFGYKIKKVAFFLIWFVLGWLLMSYLLPLIIDAAPAVAENELWQWLLPLGGGLLLALLGFSIEKVCVAGICFGLVMAVTVQYFGTEPMTLAIGAVVGVIAAGTAVALMKPATVIATAAAGAYLLTTAILRLFPEVSAEVFYWPLLGGATLIGSAVQFCLEKKH